MNHMEADRVAVFDGPWFTTINRWRKEGLPEDRTPEEYFGYEFGCCYANTSFRLEPRVIEETEEYTISVTEWGATEKRWKGIMSTPQLLGFAVTSREKWEELKPLLAYDDKRLLWDYDWNNGEKYKKAREEEKFVTYDSPISYDIFAGRITGPEILLPAMIEDPDWVRDMFETHIDLVIRCADEMMKRGMVFDAGFLYDDMGYRNGAFFSPKLYREIIMPVHKKACDYFHSREMKMMLHSCGNILEFIPMLVEAGWDCIQPLEAKAGMDVVALKKKYGDKLTFMGGIDVRLMALDDLSEIEEEIKNKIGFAKKGGGYIYCSDHSVPDDVSFANYRKVMDFVLKYGTY